MLDDKEEAAVLAIYIMRHGHGRNKGTDDWRSIGSRYYDVLPEDVTETQLDHIKGCFKLACARVADPSLAPTLEWRAVWDHFRRST